MRYFEQYLERLDWPLLTLELRRSRRSAKIFGQMLWISIGILVIGIACLGLTAGAAAFGISILVALWRGFFSFFVVPSHSSRLISAERENRTFENLALTTISCKDMVLQKAAMPICYSLALSAVLLPLDIAASVFAKSPYFCLVGSLGFICQVILYTGIGIFSSCLCSTSKNATIVTYLTIIFAPFISSSLFLTSSLLLGGAEDADVMLWMPIGILLSAAVGLLCMFLATNRVALLRRTR